MSSQSLVDLRSSLDPDDSISRGGIEHFEDTGDLYLNLDSATPGATTFTQSNVMSGLTEYIFVKDDKYKSNTKYLEGVMGILLLFL